MFLDNSLHVTRPRHPWGWTLAVTLVTVLLAALAACGGGGKSPQHYVPLRHPFRGATLYTDPNSAAARWQAANGGAPWVDPISQTPQAIWLNGPQDVAAVPQQVARARAHGALPVFVTYDIPNRDCANYQGGGAPNDAAYRAWIGQLIHNLGGTHAVIIMEPDSTSMPCFNSDRAALLHSSVARLTAAGEYVYLDAGHPGWQPVGTMASRLISAGIQNAEGFAVNVSNRETTSASYQYGRKLSDLVGNRDFVIDTSRNGIGPPPGNQNALSAWCNPAQQALGAQPTVNTGRARLAALLWIKSPGESDGNCGGYSDTGFEPAIARQLIMSAPGLPAAVRQAAAATQVPGPTGGQAAGRPAPSPSTSGSAVPSTSATG